MHKLPFASGATPYSQAERERDKADRDDVLQRLAARRKARKSGQRYTTPATPAHRRAYDRMTGER